MATESILGCETMTMTGREEHKNAGGLANYRNRNNSKASFEESQFDLRIFLWKLLSSGIQSWTGHVTTS
eukprot:m.270922 g.270922  ORF g.270922 m.270922 type:complete len:69 (+) comp40546_c0_seq17:108-314(+)